MELYEVKLYGFSSADRGRFSRNLALILEIPIDSAERILARTPVTVKNGIHEAEAKEICMRLRSINGWCTVLPENGGCNATFQVNTATASSTGRSIFGSSFHLLLGRFYPWRRLGIPAIGLAILLVIIAAGRNNEISRTEVSTKPLEHIHEAFKNFRTGVGNEESSADVEVRIQKLRSSLTSLYNKRTEIQESDKLTDPTLEEFAIQNRIRAEYQELLLLQAQLARILLNKQNKE